jgi:hypothetical protein
MSIYTEESAADLLDAIGELKEHYAEFEPDELRVGMTVCPLCTFDTLNNGGYPCSVCPWVTMENTNRVAVDAPCQIGGYNRQTAAERIARLNRWEKILREEFNL